MAYDQNYNAPSTLKNEGYGTTLSGSNETFQGPLARADGSLDELVKRAQNLADRLSGSIPTNASNIAKMPVGGNGLFGDLSALGDRMHIKIGDVHDALSRIERNLP